jgi:homeobox-leucine zipper protein
VNHISFSFLQWDILSNGGVVQEMAHIANGRDHGNCVSLLRVNVSTMGLAFHSSMHAITLAF